MAVLFDEKEFEEGLLKKAKQSGFDISYELDQFKKYKQLKYIWIVKNYVDALKRNEIPVTLKMRGASSRIAYLLGIHRVNPVAYSLSSTLFFEEEHRYGEISPRFDISVPDRDKDLAIKVLNEVSELDTSKCGAPTVFFLKENPNYRIGVYGNGLLQKAVDAIHIVNYGNSVLWFFEEDFSRLNAVDCMKFMLEEYHEGTSLPNLNGCIVGVLSEFYELMEVGMPQDLHDLAIINCLNRSIFKSRKKLIQFIKDEGLRNIIYDKNQLLDLLTNCYYMREDLAIELIDHAFRTNRLSERDELILDSLGVPKSIKDQMVNIKYLYSMPASLEEMRLCYWLAQIKFWQPNEFNELIQAPYKQSFVGPFFYINKRLYSYTDSFANHNGNERFFDAQISHMDYFGTLGIEGDYGNYPRGRVIYDNLHKKFLVYLDKDLMTEGIKKSIMLAYCLEERKTVFKTDEHYTHDGL